MRSVLRGPRRVLTMTAAVAVAAVTLTACADPAPSTTSAPAATGAAGGSAAPSSSGGAIDQAAYDAVLNGGPVADAAAVEANAWAKAIKERGVLNTGGSQTGPLFSLLDPVSGQVVGFDAGLAQLLSRYIMGEQNIQLTVTTVDTRETLIQNGTVDTVFATYSITPARAEKIAFAGPYFQSGAAIAVRKDNTDITTVADLAGKNVTTQEGSTSQTALAEQAPTATVLPFADDAACQAALTQGRADAYVIDQSSLIRDALTNPAIKVVGEPFTEDFYGIGVTRDDPAAKEFVNTWLQQIYDDGTWAKLWKATVGTVVAGEAPTPPTIGSAEGS